MSRNSVSAYNHPPMALPIKIPGTFEIFLLEDLFSRPAVPARKQRAPCAKTGRSSSKAARRRCCRRRVHRTWPATCDGYFEASKRVIFSTADRPWLTFDQNLRLSIPLGLAIPIPVIAILSINCTSAKPSRNEFRKTPLEVLSMQLILFRVPCWGCNRDHTEDRDSPD